MIKTSKYANDTESVVIAIGDPAGIGIEITLKALYSLNLEKKSQTIIVGCKKNIDFTYLVLKSKGIQNLVNPNELKIIDIPIDTIIEPGKPNISSGSASFRWLTYAADLICKGQGKALITAPICKHLWHKAGHQYPGQTERLAEITKAKEASMLFTAISPHNGWRLNTLLATTHIPLSLVPQSITPRLIRSKLEILLTFCKKFKANPTIAIAGLNPHSGEEGGLGKEEVNLLLPTLNQWKEIHPKTTLLGPIPPDTCWVASAKAWKGEQSPNCPDGILALYHDQGLIPMKTIAFDQAVNTTLGLPFIRTSPDHGTAFDIAGKGLANSESMQAAIKAAWELSK